MRIALIVLAALALLVVAGLRVPPRPFPPVAGAEGAGRRVPLPAGLPEPVERFYRRVHGDTVPVVGPVVVSGRARLRIAGIGFPARFRFEHEAGRAYRHTIHATFFGIPILRVHETFEGGRARLELPFGVTEDEPKVDEAANLGMWSEAIWFPAVWLTDERVRWEPLDARSAVLVVPFGDAEDRFVVRFGDDDLIRHMAAMRFKEADDAQRTLWIADARAWGRVGDGLVPVEAALVWLDDGRPWAVFSVEEVAYGGGGAFEGSVR